MHQNEEIYRNLESHVRALASAESAAGTFQALLAALPQVAPRGTMLLVRGDRAVGWQAWGHGDRTGGVSTLDHPIDEAHRAAWQGGTPFDETSSEIGRLGGDATERLSLSLRAEQHPIGIAMIERRAEESWSPALLELLRTVAELQLEVALIRKRAETQQPRAAAPAVASTPAPTVLSQPTADEEMVIDPAGIAEVESGKSDDDPQIEAARRFARLVATDIRLYNEEAVLQGRKHRDLLERLSEHINRGRETFIKRHGALGDPGLEILHEAYVQVLAGGDATLLPAQSDS